MDKNSQTVFLTGGTGYMGSRLAPLLMARGYEVQALTRAASASRLSAECVSILGDAIHGGYESAIPAGCTFVHLIGVAHPSPAKAAQFKSIDLAALKTAVAAAKTAQVGHFIFVSVAHPAPAMKAYIAVREECEQIIQASGLNATILRPWYVLGPGHRWPYALLPMYWIMERIPSTRASALRLGLVTLPQMLNALVASVCQPAAGIRIFDVPAIRRATLAN